MRTLPACLVALMTLTGCPDSNPAGSTHTDQPDAGPDVDVGADTGEPDADPVCTPQEETCNEVDDDCDGAVDNGFDLAGDPGNCGGCGRICDLPRATPSCNAGQCVVTECEDGWFDVDGDAANGCESEACEPTGDEVCDGADNDCDGQVDEGFDVGNNPDHCASCGDVCALDGASAGCESGVCVIDACDPGRVDTNQMGSDGCECATSNEGEETCDGEDNDCDGLVDEDIPLDVVERCGSCDTQCAYPNAIPACQEQMCALQACEDGFVNLDGRDDTGCEYACAPQAPADTEIACDDQDNDCDGMADNGTGEGEPCPIADGLDGVLTCTQRGLACVAVDADGPVELCGSVSGVLTAAGGPYRIVCPEIGVLDGTSLVVEAGAEIETGLEADAPVRVLVAGALVGTGAAWRGVGVVLAEGSVSLTGDALRATGGQVLLDATASGELTASAVTLRGPGTGLSVQGDPARITVTGTSFIGLQVGAVVATDSPLSLPRTTLENNAVGIRLITEAPGAGVLLDAGALRSTIGPAQIGIDVVGDERDSVIFLQGTTIAQRDIDEEARMDPDQLRGLSGAATVLSDVPNRVHLRGALDRADATLPALGDLVEYAAPVGLGVAALRTLTGAPDTRVIGTGGEIAISGALVAAGTTWRDLYLSPADGATLDLTDSAVEVTIEGLEGCLIQASPDAALLLGGALIAQAPGGVSPALDGLCVAGATAAAAWDGATLAGFRRGLWLTDAAAFDISGITFEDNSIGIDLQGETLAEITGNTFLSGARRQVVSVRLRTRAGPGGAVRGNLIDQDTGDLFLNLDPDCLSTDGTTIGPNTWVRTRPGSFLLGGEQEGGDVTLRDITERAPEDAFFLTVQVPDDLIVAAGATFTVMPAGQRIVTLQGLGTAHFVVEGALTLRGPGVFLSELPLSFEPDSVGIMAATAVSGSRSDAALITIDDTAPTIGGNSRFDEVQLTGSNLRDVVGVEIHSTAPMCQVPENLCPFIANNVFRNLAIGFVLYIPASYSGVNDLDDGDGEDSVPINVERR